MSWPPTWPFQSVRADFFNEPLKRPLEFCKTQNMMTWVKWWWFSSLRFLAALAGNWFIRRKGYFCGKEKIIQIVGTYTFYLVHIMHIYFFNSNAQTPIWVYYIQNYDTCDDDLGINSINKTALVLHYILELVIYM